MRTILHLKRFGAVLTASAAAITLLNVGAMSASADTAVTPDCATMTAGNANYAATTTPGAKKKDPPTLQYATFTSQFQTKAASCLGVSYNVHVYSEGGNLDYLGTAGTPSGASTTESADGTEVTVTWIGDLSTTDFTAKVLTGSGYAESCVQSQLTTELDGQVLQTSSRIEVCYNTSSGGTSYFG